MPKIPRIGDIIEIPTKRGLAYAHYKIQNKEFGALIHVLPRLFTERPADFATLTVEKSQFIAFFPLRAAVNRGIFKIVGNVPVSETDQKLPLFKARGHIDRRGRVHDWWLWDGERTWRAGRQLRPKHRALPERTIINDTLLIERIEEGWTEEAEIEKIEARGRGDTPPWGGLVGWLRRLF